MSLRSCNIFLDFYLMCISYRYSHKDRPPLIDEGKLYAIFL